MSKPPSPSAETIREARAHAGLSQTAAAELIYRSLGAWQKWEAGTRDMDPALWEYWLIRRDQSVAAAAMPDSPA